VLTRPRCPNRMRWSAAKSYGSSHLTAECSRQAAGICNCCGTYSSVNRWPHQKQGMSMSIGVADPTTASTRCCEGKGAGVFGEPGTSDKKGPHQGSILVGVGTHDGQERSRFQRRKVRRTRCRSTGENSTRLHMCSSKSYLRAHPS
jgi:hypothetical protein